MGHAGNQLDRCLQVASRHQGHLGHRYFSHRTILAVIDLPILLAVWGRLDRMTCKAPRSF